MLLSSYNFLPWGKGCDFEGRKKLAKYIPALFESAACIDWGSSEGSNAKVDGVFLVDPDDRLDNGPKLSAVALLDQVLRCSKASS